MNKNVKIRVEVRQFCSRIYNLPENEIDAFKKYIRKHYGDDVSVTFTHKGRTLYSDNFRPWVFKKRG